eukprot:8739264-Pyramimonas_sp.AAC.1
MGWWRCFWSRPQAKAQAASQVSSGYERNLINLARALAVAGLPPRDVELRRGLKPGLQELPGVPGG